MSWRFRKSFKLLPGVKINVSSRGVSTTIGGSPLSVNLGPSGAYVNISVPGTGLSLRERLAPEGSDVPQPAKPKPWRMPGDPVITDVNERVEIQSASTYELASEALAQFQRILNDASHEQQALDREIATLAPDVSAKTARFNRWNNGILFKHVMKSTFRQIETDAHDASAHLAELQEQHRLAAIATIIEVADEQKRPFGRLCDAFSRLAECNRIWDTLAIQRTNQFRERTVAAHSIERQPVRFQLGGSNLLSCEWKVPHLQNANGGDLFAYPGFLLYQVSRQSFAAIDVREVAVTVRLSQFIEEDGVPTDSEVVGETWKKANKDGSPDRRFTNNYRIPIVKYAEVALTSPSGLNERYLVSNYAVAEHFVRTWDAYAAVFQRVA